MSKFRPARLARTVCLCGAIAAVTQLVALNMGGCGPEPANSNGTRTPGTYPSNSNSDNSASDDSGVVAGETVVSSDGTFSSDTNLLDFGSDQNSLTFTLSNRGSGPIAFGIQTNAPWLNTSPRDGTLDTTLDVRVNINRGSLQNGLNLAVMQIGPSGGDPIQVTVRAWGGPGTTNGVLAASTRTLQFGDTEVSLPLDILNLGASSLAFSIRLDDPWAICDYTDGTLKPFELKTLTLFVDRGGLSNGTFTTYATLSAPGGADIRVAINVTVTDAGNGEPSELYVSHKSFDFGSIAVNRSFLIRNQGAGEMPYEVTSDAQWLTLQNGSGTSSGEYRPVVAVVDRTGLSAGDYSATLSIHTDRGDRTIAVTMTVAGSQNQQSGAVLYVGSTAINFGATLTQRSFLVRNAGKGTLGWSVRSNAQWATASPTSGSSKGEYDISTVHVDRSGLSAGTYNATVSVDGDNGETKSIAVTMQVGSGGSGISLDTNIDSIDFGDDGTTQTFTLHKTGTGALTYQVTPSDAWMIVTPTSGTLDTETDVIRVSIDRSKMIVGAYEGTVDITTDVGASASILIAANKPVFSPLIIPWIEVNTWTDADIDFVVAGMQKWNRITDTFIITTAPERSNLYTILRARVPNVKIIPGVKTASIFHGTNGFDNLQAWRRVANNVRDMAYTSGQDVVLLENETALEGYYLSEWDIDFDKLSTGLSYLPGDVEIIFYPSVAEREDSIQKRSAALCEVVEANLHCEFVDSSRGHPGWYHDPDWLQDRDTINQISEKEILPIVYFGQFNDVMFHAYNQTSGAIQQIEESRVIFYPGSVRWQESAEQIAPIIEGL